MPLILLAVTVEAFRRRNLPLAKTLLLFNVLSLETSVMFMLLALTESPDLAFVTARLRFLGMAFMPFSYIFLAAEFTGNSAWINRKTVTALLIPPIVRQSLILGLQGFSGLRIVGEGSGSDDAFRLCAEKNPDVILVELNRSAADGMNAIYILHKLHPDIKVIGVTSYFCDYDLHRDACAAGATCCLHKQASLADFVQAIRL